MACNSCSSQNTGTPKGCKNHGSCESGTCNKFSVFDWLSNMTLPAHQESCPYVEVRFKNERKSFFRKNHFPVFVGDIVTVEGAMGYDIGVVSLLGELVKLQIKKKKNEIPVKKILRKSSENEINLWQNYRKQEKELKIKAQEIADSMELKMNFCDVEYQADGKKATFFYTAESRVDFRQFIRELARAFRILVEMKQLNVRQKSAMIGGIGSCGRELCCASWLTDLRKINISAARYQQLSLNPEKLSGQCGKLKCCLNYELDSYLDALEKFPQIDVILKTKNGSAKFFKMDIFKETLWYYLENEKNKLYILRLKQVWEIIKMNKKGIYPENLEKFSEENSAEEPNNEYVMEQEDVKRFDSLQKNKKKQTRLFSKKRRNA